MVGNKKANNVVIENMKTKTIDADTLERVKNALALIVLSPNFRAHVHNFEPAALHYIEKAFFDLEKVK